MKRYAYKLLVGALLLFTMISAAYADASNGADYAVSPMGKGGYVGALLGGGSISTGFQVQATRSGTVIVDQTKSTGNALGGLLAGYGETMGNWYGGGEISATANQGSMTFAHMGTGTRINDSFSETIKIQNLFNLDVIPGYFISDSLLMYGRMGLSLGRMSFNQYKNNAGEYSFSESMTGGRAGLGIETPLTDKFTLAADYIYTNYFNNGFDEANGHEHYVVYPQDNEVALSIKYNL